MRSSIIATALLAGAVSLCSTTAFANHHCVTKGAVATSGSADSAKWFALETMVQSVSWGLWPGFLANGKVEGYNITNQKYTCKPDGGQTTCRGKATFCKK